MICTALTFLLAIGQAPNNLLRNGSFSSGFMGFASDYMRSDEVQSEGTYDVVSDPHSVHPGGASMADHTGRGGAMLVLNGSPDASKAFWKETIKVQRNHIYIFSGWAASWGQGGDVGDPSPASIEVQINGHDAGRAYALAARDGQWGQFKFVWHSRNATTAVIRLIDTSTEGIGNDFAVDDLYFGLRTKGVKNQEPENRPE